MTLTELARLFAAVAEEFRAEATHWQLVYRGIPMACLSDPDHDRMRLIAPVVEVAELDEDIKDRLIEANFHSALDARYASSNGLLFAAFIHPLGSLDHALARSALDQVASLVQTFGTSYSSGELEFMTRGMDEDEDGEDDEYDGGDDDDDDSGPLLN